MSETRGERLTKKRKQAGKTQTQLAQEIGVSRGVIQNIEYDRATPMPAVLTAICSNLGINQKWLETGEGPIHDETLALQNTILHELHREIAGFTNEELQFLLEVSRSFRRNIKGYGLDD